MTDKSRRIPKVDLEDFAKFFGNPRNKFFGKNGYLVPTKDHVFPQNLILGIDQKLGEICLEPPEAIHLN